jgi:hypothetical protein
MIYFFWPETARLSLEEISKQFGDDVAVHVNDVSEEQRRELDEFLRARDIVHSPTKCAEVDRANSDGGEKGHGATPPATEIEESMIQCVNVTAGRGAIV